MPDPLNLPESAQGMKESSPLRFPTKAAGHLAESPAVKINHESSGIVSLRKRHYKVGPANLSAKSFGRRLNARDQLGAHQSRVLKDLSRSYVNAIT